MTSSRANPTGAGRAHSSMLQHTRTLWFCRMESSSNSSTKTGGSCPREACRPPMSVCSPASGTQESLPAPSLSPLSPPSPLHAPQGAQTPLSLTGIPFHCAAAGWGDQPLQNQAPSSGRGRPGPRAGGLPRLTHHLPHSSDSAWVGGAEPGGRSAGCFWPLPALPPTSQQHAAGGQMPAGRGPSAALSLAQASASVSLPAQHSHQDRDPAPSAPADHPAFNTELHSPRPERAA